MCNLGHTNELLRSAALLVDKTREKNLESQKVVSASLQSCEDSVKLVKNGNGVLATAVIALGSGHSTVAANHQVIDNPATLRQIECAINFKDMKTFFACLDRLPK